MDEPTVYRVDLRSPEVLERVVKEYLRFAACPVDGQPFPGLLALVTLVMELPDGSERTCDAQTVLQLGPDRFIVQLMEKLDVPFLSFLGRLATRARRRAPQGETPPAPRSDSPFEGTPVAPRRQRHVPTPDAGRIAPLRDAARLRSTQPPPRVGGPRRPGRPRP